ncbi:MAG TPA: hypothetical protein VK249_29785 [Anaerolineales bacterium]|nr:hypothetical protein [Anaerolineales bacterium]
MNSFRFKNEGWLYWLAFLIALGFRFIQLGASPLTDSEATLALQALHIAQGKAPLLGPQPGYILFTSILFAIIESTNFMARFVPAIVGSMLVFVPYFFRDKIKPQPALILAFLFAIDPGLVALSRQANGTILAVAFLLFAWAMWMNRRAVPAGVFAGLAFLSGPSLWAGLLAIGLTSIFLQGMRAKPAAGDESEMADQPLPNLQFLNEYRPALLALIVTLLFSGTLFFLSPNGLSAWLSALPAYLKGWTAPSPMTPGRMVFVFFAYEPLGIFLAILSLIRGYRIKSRRIVRLSLWLGVALLLAIFYRQTSELVWAIIPLLTLAALEFSRAFNVFAEERVEVGVVVLALMILLVYTWFDVSKIALDPQGQLAGLSLPLFGRNIPVSAAPYVILFGVLLIIILCVSFVAFGWSARTARLGTTWAFVIFLGIYSLGAAWGASGVRSQNGLEFWTSDQAPVQADLLLASVDDISEFSLGHAQSQPVTLMGINSAALEWTLRNHDVKVVSTLDPQAAPPIVITPLMNDLGLPSAYRGQDFTWRQSPLWEQIHNSDWIRWLVFRQLPRENETLILWARDDLFPDARKNSQQP